MRDEGVVTHVRVTAPGKVILIGEHAVNRGASALAVSVGLHATCTVRTDGPAGVRLAGGGHAVERSRAEVFALGAAVDSWRAHEDYAAIQQLAAADFFAPAAYILAALGESLPEALDIQFESEIPLSAGLGSGGACNVALAAAMYEMSYESHEIHELALPVDAGHASTTTNVEPATIREIRVIRGKNPLRKIAQSAHRGDIIAHGGVASGLDTQTSLFGGAIRYTATRQGEPVPLAPGLTLVVGNTGVFAATSAVNGRVRQWLAERPSRLHYFHAIGLLARHAETALAAGDWPELGQLMNLNQLVLERIGVSCQELEALCEAALAAGALGAKLSGSGGGGIMVALATPETAAGIASALQSAGGTAIIAPVGVPGVRIADSR
jgi:mevalonate kinase